jgi:membrane-associated phospholipid phosphatase
MVVLWDRCRSLAIAWPVLGVLAVIVNVVLKAVVDRPRPDDPLTGVNLASYPSGHIIHATVILGLIPPTIYVLTRRPWTVWVSAAVGVVVLLATMFSRVALGAHWPTDVVAGFAVGVALLIVADLVVDLRATVHPPQLSKLHPRRWPERSRT